MGKSGKIAPSFKGKNILGEENAGIQLSRPTKKLCHHHPLTHHYSIYTLHTESRNYPCLNGRVGNSLFHTFALHYFALSLFALSLFALSLFALSLFRSLTLHSFALCSFTLCFFSLRSFDLRSLALVALLKITTGANCSCRSFLKEQRERLALVALYKKSELLFLRVGIEVKTSNSFFSVWVFPFYAQNKRAILNRGTRAIRSFRRANHPFALCLQKTNDSHEKPKSKFPTLPIRNYGSLKRQSAQKVPR